MRIAVHILAQIELAVELNKHRQGTLIFPRSALSFSLDSQASTLCTSVGETLVY